MFPNLGLVGRDHVPSYTLVGLKRVNTIKDISIDNPELRQRMFEFKPHVDSEPVWHNDKLVNMVDLVKYTSHWKTRRLFLSAVSSSLTHVKDKRHRCESNEHWGDICSVQFACKKEPVITYAESYYTPTYGFRQEECLNLAALSDFELDHLKARSSDVNASERTVRDYGGMFD